ncbi:MAG: hypothetical protein JO362_24595 [Streptomycetaceae bacterium]|nr:hypothetical protein [Streptomycetaceae bacterium]
MKYWRVEWHHDFRDEPVVIYNEIGEDGYECRKVQKYRDGHLAWADEQYETDEIGLGEVPVGTLDEVNKQPEFSAVEITADEFTKIWREAGGL